MFIIEPIERLHVILARKPQTKRVAKLKPQFLFICTAMSSALSEAFYKLSSEEEKQRYLQKLALIDGLDPYSLQAAQLSEDIASLPTLR